MTAEAAKATAYAASTQKPGRKNAGLPGAGGEQGGPAIAFTATKSSGGTPPSRRPPVPPSAAISGGRVSADRIVAVDIEGSSGGSGGQCAAGHGTRRMRPGGHAEV